MVSVRPALRAAKLHRGFLAVRVRRLVRRLESAYRGREQGRSKLGAALFRCRTRAAQTIGRTLARSTAAAVWLPVATPNRRSSEGRCPHRQVQLTCRIVFRKGLPRLACSKWRQCVPRSDMSGRTANSTKAYVTDNGGFCSRSLTRLLDRRVLQHRWTNRTGCDEYAAYVVVTPNPGAGRRKPPPTSKCGRD
jgi:hypothetical protein